MFVQKYNTLLSFSKPLGCLFTKSVCAFGTERTVKGSLEVSLVRYQQEGNLSSGSTDEIFTTEKSSLNKIPEIRIFPPDLYPFFFCFGEQGHILSSLIISCSIVRICTFNVQCLKRDKFTFILIQQKCNAVVLQKCINVIQKH